MWTRFAIRSTACLVVIPYSILEVFDSKLAIVLLTKVTRDSLLFRWSLFEPLNVPKEAILNIGNRLCHLIQRLGSKTLVKIECVMALPWRILLSSWQVPLLSEVLLCATTYLLRRIDQSGNTTRRKSRLDSQKRSDHCEMVRVRNLTVFVWHVMKGHLRSTRSTSIIAISSV